MNVADIIETVKTYKDTPAVKSSGRYGRFYSPYAVVILRVIIGALFVISGFSKLVDPWGFIFKIEDYLTVWAITEPRTIVLVVALALSFYEFVFGFLLMTGCFKRVAPWLLMLFMSFMLPLTAYIWIANPVDDCGCFGEMWKISNAATFWKNVFLTVGLIYLCKFNARFRRSLYRPAIQAFVVTVLLFYALLVSLYGYNIQPMIDFRPYPVGSNLAEMLNEGDADDDMAVKMLYSRDGEERVFTIEELPDSTWTFVRRIDEAPASASKSGFTIYDAYDDDVTDEVINDTGKMLILVIPEANRVDIAYTYAINEMNKAITREGGEMIALIASTTEGIDRWIDMSMADYPCYMAEDTSLKQLARGSMSMVYLDNGVVKWKRSLAAFDFATVDALSNNSLTIDDIEINDGSYFKVITIAALALLIVIALFQEFIVRLLPQKQKKQLTLQSEKEDDAQAPTACEPESSSIED